MQYRVKSVAWVSTPINRVQCNFACIKIRPSSFAITAFTLINRAGVVDHYTV